MPSTLYLAASLPLVLVALLATTWWSVLPRPWLFVATGIFSLYVLLAVVVVAVVLIGPGPGSHFLEAPSPSSTSTKSLPVVELFAVGVFLALGTAILRAFKRWLL